MRRKAGSRVALASIAPPRAHSSGRYVASVLRAGDQLAELRWELADGVDDQTIIVAHLDGQRAWLEHRRAAAPEVAAAEAAAPEAAAAGPAATRAATAGVTDMTDTSASAAPHAHLRLLNDENTVLATADAHRHGPAERWSLRLDDHRLQLDAPLRARPRRYQLHQPGRQHDEAGRVETCRRPHGWALEGPDDLSTAASLMGLWLVHLIDLTRFLDRGRLWHAPPEWTVLLDDSGRLAPGGFGGFGTSGGGGLTPT